MNTAIVTALTSTIAATTEPTTILSPVLLREICENITQFRSYNHCNQLFPNPFRNKPRQTIYRRAVKHGYHHSGREISRLQQRRGHQRDAQGHEEDQHPEGAASLPQAPHGGAGGYGVYGA
jgi:hypothetical protein